MVAPWRIGDGLDSSWTEKMTVRWWRLLDSERESRDRVREGGQLAEQTADGGWSPGRWWSAKKMLRMEYDEE
nr:hypothetical protein Iba_chr07bCG7630 [Ipomoea batatas]